MTHAVHSLHAPASKEVEGGYSVAGNPLVILGTPIFEAETREEAEEWRLARLEERRG